MGAGCSSRSAFGAALSPDEQTLAVTDRCASVAKGSKHPVGVLLKIDIAKAGKDPHSSVVDAVPAGCDPVRVAVSPSGATLWVTARGDNTLLRVSAIDLRVGGGRIRADSIHIGREPVGVAVRPDGKQVWVALSARFASGEPGLAGLGGIDGDGKVELIEFVPTP